MRIKKGRDELQRFEIKDEFLLNGQPFKILSGAIHYFRLHPDDWYHSLYNLKALGFNTVETYIPWNLHESQEGNFHFDQQLDIEQFLKVAQSLDLYAILRPSPYICAEWEFGGLPAWLLNKNCRIRSSDPKYLACVSTYYQQILPRLAKHQLSENGNVLMFQVENEYGSYGEDKEYLTALKKLMKENGITAPLFTSDGPWQATLRAGSLIDEDILVTGNFGSNAQKNFTEMKKFFKTHGKKWPLMCMEFWDGWFNRWGEPIVKRETKELVEAFRETIELGSINLYMFHGGTNFGFMNGCSARGNTDLPQITSYDYGAPLNEQGNPTDKYYALQETVREVCPVLASSQKMPLIKPTIEIKDIPLKNKVSLFATITKLTTPLQTKYPVTMEAMNQTTGYIIYRTILPRDAKTETLRIIDGSDRAQTYLNGQHIVTQYQAEIGENILVEPTKEQNQLDILIENMGRVNYGAKLTANTQKKGIRTGVMADLHFINDWEQFSLPLDTIESVDFSGEWVKNQPSFYQYEVDLTEIEDTFIDLANFGKGVVFVNNHHLGRFWEIGPTLSLYIPKGFLHIGKNKIVIFETEGKYDSKIDLLNQPKFKSKKRGNKK